MGTFLRHSVDRYYGTKLLRIELLASAASATKLPDRRGARHSGAVEAAI